MHWAGGPGISKINRFPIVAPIVFYHNSRSLTKIPLIVSPAPGVSFCLVAIAVSSGLISMGFSQMEEE